MLYQLSYRGPLGGVELSQAPSPCKPFEAAHCVQAGLPAFSLHAAVPI